MKKKDEDILVGFDKAAEGVAPVRVMGLHLIAFARIWRVKFKCDAVLLERMRTMFTTIVDINSKLVQDAEDALDELKRAYEESP